MREAVLRLRQFKLRSLAIRSQRKCGAWRRRRWALEAQLFVRRLRLGARASKLEETQRFRSTSRVSDHALR
eukprot:11946122-Alexandrium_andersonii.AAC.1